MRFPRAPAAGCAAALLVALAPAGCRGTAKPPREPSPIVVITLDTLRADHLGCYGYFRDTSPHLDRLAAEGVLFERAVTTIATTLPAHLSLFTSRHPLQTGVFANGKKFRLRREEGSQVRLFSEMLDDLGYETAAFVSATPVKRPTGLGVGFDLFDQPERKGRRADRTVDRAIEWLEGTPSRPFLLWIHLFDPHSPYDPPGRFKQAFSAGPDLVRFLWRKGVPDPWDAGLQSINDRYDGEILFADTHLGRLFEALSAGGLYSESTIVVVGDHGEGLGQHDRIGHGEIHNEQLLVPLIIRFPDSTGLNGRRVERLVSIVDVLPTLIERLGMEIAAEDRAQLTGSDLLARGPRRPSALAQRTYGPKRKWGPGQKYALIEGDWKYTFSTHAPDELFDLARDPAEIENLIDREPRRAAGLRSRLERMIAELSEEKRRFDVEDETSEDALRELRSLGYVP